MIDVVNVIIYEHCIYNITCISKRICQIIPHFLGKISKHVNNGICIVIINGIHCQCNLLTSICGYSC